MEIRECSKTAKHPTTAFVFTGLNMHVPVYRSYDYTKVYLYIDEKKT